MGLRALVGVENAGGSYQARAVQLDGCPTVIVPVLSHLIHQRYEHRVGDAVQQLMGGDWWRLHMLPATFGHQPEVILEPSGHRGEPHTGHLAGDHVGDKEWAYLVGGHRLHVYLGVREVVGPKRWEPWACWSLHDLPGLPYAELLDVQRSGYSRQWMASSERSYVEALAERFEVPVAQVAAEFDLLSFDECQALGLDGTLRDGSEPHTRSGLSPVQRRQLDDIRKGVRA